MLKKLFNETRYEPKLLMSWICRAQLNGICDMNYLTKFLLIINIQQKTAMMLKFTKIVWVSFGYWFTESRNTGQKKHILYNLEILVTLYEIISMPNEQFIYKLSMCVLQWLWSNYSLIIAETEYQLVVN